MPNVETISGAEHLVQFAPSLATNPWSNRATDPVPAVLHEALVALDQHRVDVVRMVDEGRWAAREPKTRHVTVVPRAAPKETQHASRELGQALDVSGGAKIGQDMTPLSGLGG